METRTPEPESDDSLKTMITYYRARAREYNEWFLRRGRYDHGADLNRRWFAEVESLRHEIAAVSPSGHLLELACGTGLWTAHLLQYADRITALDAAAEMIDINRERVRSSRVHYLQAEIFSWVPQEEYDFIFFAFWLSHVPPERFVDFWRLVDRALKRSGRVFFIDSRYEPTSTARDQHLPSLHSASATRRLNDGREFRIIKVFYEPDRLAERLRDLGWDFQIEQTPSYFIYGKGRRLEGQ